MTARLYTFAGLLGALGLGFLWLTLQLPGSEAVSTRIGPRTWPLAVLVTMLALIALMFLLLALRGPTQFVGAEEAESPDGTQEDTAASGEPAAGAAWRHLAVLAVTIAYTVAMEYTGYLVATAAFAGIVNVILGERRPLRILATVIVAVAIVAVVFDRLLHIPLP